MTRKVFERSDISVSKVLSVHRKASKCRCIALAQLRYEITLSDSCCLVLSSSLGSCEQTGFVGFGNSQLFGFRRFLRESVPLEAKTDVKTERQDFET